MSTGRAKKAVICVFDGLRPDRVTEELTPNLWRFAMGGTWFRESRSVFPSVTRVATTSFATGSKPETHGIVDNAFFLPAVITDRLLDTSNAAHLRAAEAQSGGGFVEAEGLGCALARAGKSYSVVHTGSAGSGYLVNHRAAENGHWTFSIHGAENTQTPEAVEEVVTRFGPLPKSAPPKSAEIDYGATVFIDHVLARRRPDVALIWFCEPDTSYHYRDIGSDDAIAVTRQVDARFGAILDAVAYGPDADETLVVAMSDHGQIATTREVDLHGDLTRAGFRTSSQLEHGVEVVATRGACVGLTLTEPNAARLSELATVLMDHPDTGMLFSHTDTMESGIVPGTLPYSLVGLEHPRAPDLVWVALSSAAPDQHGLPGSGAFSGGVPCGGGMHGGLNSHELNTLLAFGGAGVSNVGIVNDPADLTDITPTILDMLGLPVPSSMPGTPLVGLAGRPRPDMDTRRVTAGRGAFQQELILSQSARRPIVLSGGRLL